VTDPAPPPSAADAVTHATIRLASVTGATATECPDPTEDYHEASRIYPGVVAPVTDASRTVA